MQDLLNSYKAKGRNTSLKIHFLESHFDISQTISAKSVTNTAKDFTAEKRYQSKWTSSMLADYCWKMNMDVPDAKYWRKS